MNFKRKLKYFAASFLMVASAITPLGNGFVRSAYADDDVDPEGAPVRSKTLKDNGDGTYTINLSVTGETSTNSTSNVSKANVILVVDTSSSMNQETGSIYYAVSGTPTDPSKDGNTAPKYYRNNNGTYSQIYYRDGNWCTNDHGTCTQFSGQFYAKTRLWAEKHALTDDNGIIDQLLAQNVANNERKKDIIEVAVVGFGMNGEIKQGFTTSSTDLKNSINGLTTDSGTNWEEALQKADSLADTISVIQPNEKNYVLFLTDGQPSVTATNSTIASNTSGWNAAWDAAKDDARGIVTDGYELYSLFTWGSSSYEHYLTSLVGYAYTGSGSYNDGYGSYGKYYTNADSTETLIAALRQIISDITTNVGYTGVEMTDGITTMTASGIKANTDGDIKGIKYYRSGGAYSTTANDGLGDEWTDAPKAVINSKGEIDWNLNELVLEDDVTYTISFVVWPKQESLDLIANLNNGVVKYEDLTEEERSQIIKSSDKYTLKTNTDYPTLTYKTVTTTTTNGQTETVVSSPQTVRIKNPDPVDLYQEEVELQKLWEDSLDPSQREDNTEVQDIYLQFYKKDFSQTEYQEYDQFHENYDASKGGIKVKKVAGSTTWSSGKIAIAPGLMVSEGRPAFDENSPYGVVVMNSKRYSILNPGHDYKFGEADINNHFELTNYIYHPMLVDGTLMNVAFTRSGNTFTGVESAKEMSVISATNTIKGGVNIQKKIVDKAGNEVSNTDDKFTIIAYLKNPDDNSDYGYDYRVYCSKAHDDCNQELKDSSGNVTGYRSAHIYGSGIIERVISTDDIIRVVNMNTGTLYHVEESDVPVGYSLKDVEYRIAYGGENAKDDKAAKTIDGKDYYAVAGNSASLVTVVNNYISGNLKLTKNVVVQSGNATTVKNKEFIFTVRLYANADKTSELAGSYKIDGSTNTIKSGGTVRLKDGESLTILDLPIGAYYEVVETEAAGFTTTKTGDTGTIAEDITSTAAFTNTYSVSGKVKIEVKKDFNDWRTGDKFVFKLSGDGIADSMTATIDGADKKAEFEVPINSTGTFEYMITEDLQASSVRGGIKQTSGNITASVTATDNGEGGLNFNVAYQGGEGEKLNTIVNRYSATGKIRLGASKILTGRDWQEGELYNFTLMGEDGAEIENKSVSKAQPDVVYSEISYTLEDAGKTFVYTIHESTPLPGGITNSGDVTATVTVDDNHDGTLKTTVVYSGGQGEKYNTIVNTYSAEGEFGFEATKVLEGRNWQSGESYNFVLEDKDGNVVDTQIVDRDHTAVSFKKLKFTQADVGEHKYTITETGTMPSGLSKSEDIDVNLTVTDDKNGNLAFKADYSNNGTITNTYKAKPVEVIKPFTVKKKINDQSNSKKDATFKFELRDDKNVVVQTKEITTKELAGSVDFDSIKFDKAGTYEYALVEIDDGQAGFSYDDTEHKVVIEVTDDYEKAQLVAKVTIDGKEINEVEFENDYRAEATSTKIDFEKILSGIDQNLAKEFEFVLSDKNGIIQVVKIKGSGKAEFNEIKFDKADEYTYTVKEAKGDAKGYVYDESEYIITVRVSDNDAKLETEVSYHKNGEDAEAIIFENSYKPEEVIYGCPECEVPIAVKKVLENRVLKDKEFKFNIYLGNELVATGYNLANGEIVLNNGITFDEAGMYSFVIKEDVADREQDITYDENEYTFVVEVEDDGEGELKVSSDTSSDVVFTNKYNKPGKGYIPPEPPVTNDSVATSVVMLSVSLIGLIGSLVVGKRYLEKEKS